MIKRTHLAHFVAVVECGGFTAAARRLHLTQPTVSASVAELERMVGSSLIVRDRKRIRVTEAGHLLLSLARNIERDFRLAESTLATGCHPPRPIRLGLLASAPLSWAASFRRHYCGVRPLIFVEGTESELRRRLHAGQLDASVLVLRTHDEAIGPVHEESYAALLPQAHSLAFRSEIRAEELAGEVMVARRSCEILGETSNFFTSRGIRPHFLMRSASEDRCLNLVKSGFAITTGPESLAGDGIVAVQLEEYEFRRTIGLVLNRGSQDETLGAAWAKLLQEHFGAKA